MSPLARAWVEVGPLLEIGWIFVAAMGAFGALGWWLDGRLLSRPKLMIAGLVFGMAVGFLNLFKVVQNLDKRKKR
jgi:F0F1-type ATP synthase assembly protein I